MPRRTTLTYSSEDAPDVHSEQIYVYYCKCAAAAGGPAPSVCSCSVHAPLHCGACRRRAARLLCCRFSGKHALTTNCELRRAPRRRTDGASVVDTQVYTAKLYTTDGGAKLIRRPEGHIEKQYRQNLGKLPIAYRRAACAGPSAAQACLRRLPRTFPLIPMLPWVYTASGVREPGL